MKKEIKKSFRGRKTDGSPNPIDIHVGHRIRLRRTLLSLSQEKLASMLGLTFQQVQKYERGINRVSASRLWDISKVLDTPIGFFYEEMGADISGQSPRMQQNPSGTLVEINDTYGNTKNLDPMQSEDIIALAMAFLKIRSKNPKLARCFFETIKTASKSSNEESYSE